MWYLLNLCCILSLSELIKGNSHSDPKIWHHAKKCEVTSGAEGRCITYNYCPLKREELEMPLCGTGKFPDLCCESKPEDFVQSDYGRVARQECNKFMNNLEWKKYGYVFGGVNARPKEFTFMAALGYGANVSNIKYHCGGSLISDRHVLTAAHCLFSPEDGPVRYVLLGDLDILSKTDDAQPQYLYVQNVTVHPQYKHSSAYNDIAILHLNKPAKFNEYVQPACLDFGQLPVEANRTTFYATGWGLLGTGEEKATHMQEVELVPYDFDKCNKVYPMNRRKLALGLADTQMCAGGAVERKDTCQGDSGGPLSRTNADIRYPQYKGYIVVGVTSFGKLCGYTNAPGVYTRVEKYIPWIESVVWPDVVDASGTKPQVIPQIQEQVDLPSNGYPNPINTNDNIPNKFTANKLVEPQVVAVSGNNNPQVMIQVSVTIQTSTTNSAPQENSVYRTTMKPVNLIDIHYFSDKK